MTDEYIAEAQRVSIAQNKTLKFFYQTWWAWWLPRIVIVVMMIVLYFMNQQGSTIAVLGVILFLSFTGEWFGQWNLAKARKKVRTKGTASTVTMNDQGIDIEGANGNSHLKWSAMLQPAIYPDGVLIKFSRFAMVWLPDLALIDGSPVDVRNLLAENVKDSS